MLNRITNLQAYEMGNDTLVKEALNLTYRVGEITTDAEAFDFAASMSALLTEIKVRAKMGKFTISDEANYGRGRFDYHLLASCNVDFD